MSVSRALSIVQKFHPDVDKIKDATRAVTIEVTKSDVRSSQTKSHRTCAIATACKRMLHLDGVVISRAIAYLIKDGVATRYRVSDAAAREVIAFDRGGSFEPGEYRLVKPDHTIALGVERGTEPRPKDKRKKHDTPRHITTNIRAALGGTK